VICSTVSILGALCYLVIVKNPIRLDEPVFLDTNAI
jgi:hypothetical protein